MVSDFSTFAISNTLENVWTPPFPASPVNIKYDRLKTLLYWFEIKIFYRKTYLWPRNFPCFRLIRHRNYMHNNGIILESGISTKIDCLLYVVDSFEYSPELQAEGYMPTLDFITKRRIELYLDSSKYGSKIIFSKNWVFCWC